MKINIAEMKCDMIRMQVGMHNMDPSTQDEFLHSQHKNWHHKHENEPEYFEISQNKHP